MYFREWLVGQKYYHGSFTKMPVGTILRPSPQYEQNWGGNQFYKILEKYRPPNMIAHKNAVFMVDNLEDIDSTGSPDAFIYEVQALGPVQRCDMNWSSEIDLLMDTDEQIDENALKKVAMHYWQGKPHYNESVWEYLTTKAVIVALVEEN